MSMTLIPLYYAVNQYGRPARLYTTIADVAAAAVSSTRTVLRVGVVTGGRRRSPRESELRELGRQVHPGRPFAFRVRHRRPQSVTDDV